MNDRSRPKAAPETASLTSEASVQRGSDATGHDTETSSDEGDVEIRCEVAGVYCSTLTIEQLQAAGRAGVCCRHYLQADDRGAP